MKKITLLFAFLLATIGWQSNAQFTEDFEGTFLPTGWAKVVQSGNDITQSTSQNHTPSGANSCRFSSFSSSSDYNQYLFTDAITVQAGVNDFISFYHKKYNSTELLEWGIATAQDATTVTTWTAVTLSHTDWVIERIDLSAYVGQTIYFAWHYFGDYTYYVYIDDVVNEPVPTAFDPSFTLAAVPDCANNQFSIDVDITDLGGATSVTVSDDQGSATQQATATGVVTMGPYPNGTDVAITVTNDQDASYTATDNAQFYCPPANDTIAGAIPITPSAEGTGCDSNNYTFQAWQAQTGVTDSGLDGSCNSTYTGLDVFYSWTATSIGLVWNDGDGAPGIVIRDAATGNEITCEGTWASDDVVLSGWNIGDDLIIQIYDFDGDDVDVSFCLEERNTFNPTFNLLATSVDCTNNQFSIDVNITDLGGASSVTISDDQGSATQQATAAGSFTFGPYAFGTTVAITVTNDQDNSYTATDSFVVNGCPPANDECDNAVALTVNEYNTCDNTTSGTTQYATPSPQTDDVTGYPDNDVWFSFVATQTEHVVELTNITAVSGTSTDMGMGLYDGTNGCSNLTLVDDSDPNTMTVSSLTVGTTYYVRVYGWWSGSSSAEATFDICVRTNVASIEDNRINNFKFYPNPVNNTLNMSAQDNIEKVSIYNISGQEVINVTPNAVQTQVDMSRLQNGIYFVKAQVNGQLTAFKVVKK
jgi:hypothetical protein